MWTASRKAMERSSLIVEFRLVHYSVISNSAPRSKRDWVTEGRQLTPPPPTSNFPSFSPSANPTLAYFYNAVRRPVRPRRCQEQCSLGRPKVHGIRGKSPASTLCQSHSLSISQRIPRPLVARNMNTKVNGKSKSRFEVLL